MKLPPELRLAWCEYVAAYNEDVAAGDQHGTPTRTERNNKVKALRILCETHNMHIDFHMEDNRADIWWSPKNSKERDVLVHTFSYTDPL